MDKNQEIQTYIIGQNRSDLKDACVNKLEIHVYEEVAGGADSCSGRESPAGSLGIYLRK